MLKVTIVFKKMTILSVLSHFSHVQLFETPCTVTLQAPLSMGFSRQEYWNELLGPPAVDLSKSGVKSASFMSPALAGRFFTTSTTWEARTTLYKETISS